MVQASLFMIPEQKDGGLVPKIQKIPNSGCCLYWVTGLKIAGSRVFYSADGQIVDRENVFVKNDK